MDDRKWISKTPLHSQVINSENLRITCNENSGASLISGSLVFAIQQLAPSAPILGALDIKPVLPFLLRISRDRGLLCTEKALKKNGWFKDYAISAADDLYQCFEITGNRWKEVLSACCTVQISSPSASCLFAGHTCLVVRNSNGFSVYVEKPEAAALWGYLEQLVNNI